MGLGSQKRYLNLLLIVACHECLSQDAVPLFKTKADSAAYHSAQHAMRNHDPLSPKQIPMDSLWAVQQQIIKTGIIGWKYTYHRDGSFVPLQDLLDGKIEPHNVKKLSVVNYDGRKLPDKLFDCKHLEELELIQTKIEKMPKQLNHLSKLHSIEIYNNRPSKRLRLARNNTVTFLKFRSDEPRKIPLDYKKFKSLDSLDLSRNFLTEFPNIDQNKNLRQLVLSENNLTLKKLKLRPNTTLQCLYVRKNKIEVLPDALGNLTALKKLSFNYNEIREVSDAVGRLQNLEELSFYQNKLTSIPRSFYQLKNLKVIDLYYNQIEKIEEPITNLKRIEILYIANNRIHTLPDNIGDLTNLRELYLHHNRISYFPPSFASLKSLKVLRLNNNYFAAFPYAILSLNNLENLDISHNRLQSLPSEFGSYEKLELLVMSENPWEDQENISAFASRMRSHGTQVHLNSMSSEVEITSPQN